MRASLRGFRTLMGFSFGAAPLQAALFLSCGAIMAVIPAAAAYAAKVLVDAAVAHDVYRGLGAAGALALCAALGILNTVYYIDFLFTVAEKTGAAVDCRLIYLIGGMGGLEHHERPDYLDQLDLLREERRRLAWMTNALAGILRVAVQLLVSGVLLARLHPALLLLPLAGFVSFLTGRKAQELQLNAMETTAEGERLRRHLFEIATSGEAGKETRIFDLTDELVRRHGAVARGVNAARDRADWRGAAIEAAGGLISGAAYVGAIWLVLSEAVQGHATPGDVVLAVGLAATLNGTITTAVLYGTEFLRILQLSARYLWLADYAAAGSREAQPPASVPQHLTEGIELEGITFRYPGTAATILDHISLTLPAGAVVAVVGDNGAGKTTLVKLLSRFYEPAGGRILIDGVDLRRFPLNVWRSRIAAAFQDFVRFEFPLRQVVGVGDLPRIEDRPAVQTALVHAGAADLPTQLPAGLDTQLGKSWEGGVDLSGGQWQKLALGRAMMRESPLLLILDEPTASLDAETEHALFERYARAARESAGTTGTITLLVSHRFSTVRMADLIVVIDAGHIIELGNHEELMARGGLYAELYELQARQYR